MILSYRKPRLILFIGQNVSPLNVFFFFVLFAFGDATAAACCDSEE